MSLKPVLARLGGGETLTEDEAEAAFGIIMDGAATQAQIAGLLMAMRVRGETVAELTGAVRAMRAKMVPVPLPAATLAAAIDVCGTGGDAAGTLNVSTGVAFVLAGAGVPVAKHGNRALTSRTGGADVLAALGVTLEVPAGRQHAVLDATGVAFLFAPHHHAAMRHAAVPRAELGTRTIFNLLGPLANPAGVRRQLVGVFARAWVQPVAQALARLGATHACVVHGTDAHGAGLDEFSLAGDNHVAVLVPDGIAERVITPEDAGLPRADIAAIAGGDAAHNAARLAAMLHGEPGAYRDTVLFNAAAALIVAGRARTLAEGVAVARRALDSGRAAESLTRLRAATAEAAALL